MTKGSKSAGSGKRGKAPAPKIVSGGTTTRLGRNAPARRGNRGGKG